MNVSELFDLTHWVTDEIVAIEIPKKYQTLQKILQQHSQPNQEKQSFEDEKNDLIETLKMFLFGSSLKINYFSCVDLE